MKQYRLNRLFNASSKRCFDVAVDHGFFNQPGFLQGIEDMRQVVATLVDAGPDASSSRSVRPATCSPSRASRSRPSSSAPTPPMFTARNSPTRRLA